MTTIFKYFMIEKYSSLVTKASRFCMHVYCISSNMYITVKLNLIE